MVMSSSLKVLVIHIVLAMLLWAAIYLESAPLLRIAIFLTWLMIVGGVLILGDKDQVKRLEQMNYRSARIVVHAVHALTCVSAGYVWCGFFYLIVAACLWPEEKQRVREIL